MTTAQTTHAPPALPEATETDHPHLVSPWLLVTVFGGLFVLTILTVLVSRVDLGRANIFVALLIAAAKASLVVLYFMHLRWDSPFYSIIMVSALIFVVCFIGMAMMDSLHYSENFTAPFGTNVTAKP